MSTRARVLIIGNCVSHEVQKVRTANDGHAKAKDVLKSLLVQRITERTVRFIGEEAQYGHETIAETLKTRKDGWINMDMPMQERDAAGIAEEQRDRGCIPRYVGEEARCQLTENGYEQSVGNGWIQLIPRLPSDEIREQYMFDRVVENFNSVDSILLLCGVLHSQALAAKFGEAGFEVELEFWKLKNADST